MQNVNNWKPYPLSWERLFTVLFIYYVLFRLVFPPIAYSMQINEDIMVEGIHVKYQMLVYIVSVIPCLFLMYPILKVERKLNLKRIFTSIFIVLVGGYLLNILFNLFITWFNHGYVSSNNQNGLDVLASQNKGIFLTMTLFLAPVLEELVFRGAIFHFIRERKSFLLSGTVSGLLFGFVHVFSSLLSGNLIDFFYLFLYSTLGLILCAVYEYNQSIYACILVHVFYNAMASLNIIFS